MSNLGHAIKRLYLGTHPLGAGGRVVDDTAARPAPATLYEERTRQMVCDLKEDIDDLKAINRAQFLLVTITIVAEIIRTFLK